MFTQIHKLNKISDNNNFYVKREDFIPTSFGGNKARKAKLFFADIQNKNADCVVTYGSSSSNHCRIVANLCASKGLACYLISPEENAKETFNSKLMHFFNAEIITCPVKDVAKTIDNLMMLLKEQGKTPYFIAGGGHGNIGTEAYVQCFNEILEQQKTIGINFDYIFHASGTGTTQAGLVCGKLLSKNADSTIVGISIARSNPRGRQVVVESVNDYLMEKNVILEVTDIGNSVLFVDDYICGGYGRTNDDVNALIKEVLIKEGMPLDHTYTGKAFYGMMDYLKKNKIVGKNILFIHTGGTPLFFDDLGGK
ncbi:MAG: pyridoxal-phosphate dependent enzyme [Clostridia bacterium]|nr:pyridoxal-phosphate dependent enzyme [Clostridia bacterium]